MPWFCSFSTAGGSELVSRDFPVATNRCTGTDLMQPVPALICPYPCYLAPLHTGFLPKQSNQSSWQRWKKSLWDALTDTWREKKQTALSLSHLLLQSKWWHIHLLCLKKRLVNGASDSQASDGDLQGNIQTPLSLLPLSYCKSWGKQCFRSVHTGHSISMKQWEYQWGQEWTEGT